MIVEELAVDHLGYVPESNLEVIGELTYRDNRTGEILVQEWDRVLRITASHDPA